MPQTADRWTADMVRALPDDGNRYEVIDGDLFVTPSPRRVHQRAAVELSFRLSEYLRERNIAEVLMSPADISFAGDMLVQPDVFVAPFETDGRRGEHWTDIMELLLAIEVLSPSTARADRQVKRRLYQRHKVGEYWIVDLDARVIERWKPGDARPEILSGRLVWQPVATHAALEMDLPSLFAGILGIST